MYILKIARGIPSHKYPLLGIFEFDQAKALHNDGHKVIYFSIDFRSIKKIRYFGYRKFYYDGILVYEVSLPLHPLNYIWMYKIGCKIGSLVLKKIFKDNGKPDIIHSHFNFYSAIAANLSERCSIPLVVTEHSSLINKDIIDKKNYYLSEKSYSIAKEIISVSTALKNKIYNNFKIESIVIPNIVDTSNFYYTTKRYNNETDFTFVTVGRLIESKGYKLLLNAFLRLSTNNVKLIIIGDGPMKESIKNFIINNNLGNKILIKGQLNRKEINTIFSKSHVFVLPSYSETFGVSYIEAMASGLPIIATRCGGPEDFVNSTNGVLIPINSENDLYQVMLNFYKGVYEFDYNFISRYSKENFSSKIISEKLNIVYKKIVYENS